MPSKENKQVQILKDYQSTFGSIEGKKILYHLMQMNHVLGSCMVAGDPYQSAFKEGERNVILKILAILKQDPAKILEQIEQNGKETENDYV